MPSPTPSQQQAIQTPGNVLVMAGAGTGKTRTLIERCLARLLDERSPCSLDEILIVTFTEAAAAEMKHRLRRRLSEVLAERPADRRVAEQLALVDTAPIGTLHSFCLRLVRDHFHDLNLDPQITVLEESRALILAAETLSAVLEGHYRGRSAEDEAVRELIVTYGEGRDEPIRRLVRRVHEYAQTLPHPEGWLKALEAAYQRDTPPDWEELLRDGFDDLGAEWEPVIAKQDHPILRECAAILARCPETASRSDIAAACAAIRAADDDAVWKCTKSKGTVRKACAEFFAAAAFLGSLAERSPAGDPLLEDWQRIRPHLLALARLVVEFGTAYAAAKRELAAVDFHDLEQFALRLLWNAEAGQPTALARACAARFQHVLVDEYQDINAAQDCLLRALSRPAPGNRFLVGDVKQSIYRFRLANPRIFQHYAATWRGGKGRSVSLRDNFRSHEAILDFVNALFAGCLRPEIGGVAYDDEARLMFDNRGEREPLARRDKDGVAPRVELWLRLKSKEDAESDAEGEGDAPDSLNDVEAEARWIAQRLQALKQQPLPVWDESARAFRPVRWGDMVILLRGPRQRAELFARVFQRFGIPLSSSRRGFYHAVEISDLLSLLTLLDNPIQDLPLLAVLRSPLVGMTLDELAAIRLADRSAPLWLALLRFRREGAALSATGAAKADRFLERFVRWREQARQGALSACLETVLDDTLYEDWLLAQPQGEQRRANVQRLLTLVRQFDHLQHQGLYRFLRQVAAQQEVEFDPEPANLEAGDTVRLMSIHQSKGLEFPVVVVAALGTGFNRTDLNASVILDESLGLCPLVRTPDNRSTYSSLPHWLAKRHQEREQMGEEQRLLYVAATRAVDRLILVGSAPRKRAEEQWKDSRRTTLSVADIVGARSCLDWIGPLLWHLTERDDWLDVGTGESRLLAWRIVEGAPACPDGMSAREIERAPADHEPEPQPQTSAAGGGEPKESADEDAAAQELIARLDWTYPDQASTTEPAKTSVTALRRRLVEETDGEAHEWFRSSAFRRVAARALTAAERGVAHHRFLQHVALDRVGRRAELVSEAARLRAAGRLTAAEHDALDFEALARFWTSDLGRRVAEDPAAVYRELEFTARLTVADLRAWGLPVGANTASDEFVVVQGVADLVVRCPDSLWLLDFKTDEVTAETVTEKARDYASQLALYARALERIHGRPVTEAWLHFLTIGRSIQMLPTAACG